MQLWLIRHAVAHDHSPTGRDADRELTEKGRELFRDLSQWIIKRAGAPDFIVSSPLVRTQQTSEILAEVAKLHSAQVLVDEVMAPGVNFSRLVTFLRNLHGERIAIVGHQPDMSHLFGKWNNGGLVSFSKGAFACLEFSEGIEANGGELRWYITPKLLAGLV